MQEVQLHLTHKCTFHMTCDCTSNHAKSERAQDRVHLCVSMYNGRMTCEGPSSCTHARFTNDVRTSCHCLESDAFENPVKTASLHRRIITSSQFTDNVLMYRYDKHWVVVVDICLLA